VKKRNKKKPLVGILLGKASTSTKAKSIAHFFKKCPYCASCASVDCTFMGIFSLPQNHRWWLVSIQKHPKETVGFENAEVFFTKKVEASSPCSSGTMKLNLKRPPCGADCKGCPAYRKECKGCISTKYYLV
jgi:hypothetical protein